MSGALRSDTESADIKATSTATTATTTAATAATDTSTATASDAPRKSKRLPSFSAIFKRLNERDAAKKRDTESGAAAEGAAAANAAGAAAANEPTGDGTDGNDNEPKEDKQLVYAELVLKPAGNNEPPLPPKSSTEYAEIVYVQKTNAEQPGKK